jgi:hypothetical protein
MAKTTPTKQELEIAVKDKVLVEVLRQRDLLQKAIMEILPDKTCPKRGMLAAALANIKPSDAYRADMELLLSEYDKQPSI